MEEKTVNETPVEATDNNDDMVAATTDTEETISFKLEERPAPERGWTKKQKRSVIIIAVVITVIAAVAVFFLQSIDFNYFSLFG